MGSAKRIKPVSLSGKLLLIRKNLDYSLSAMAATLSSGKITLRKQDISHFEKGEREPNLIILLRYARLARIPVEVLIDDDLNL